METSKKVIQESKKIRIALNNLKRQYDGFRNEAKMNFLLVKSEINESKITKSVAKTKLRAELKKYQQKQLENKKWYQNQRILIYKNNTLSVDQEQYDQIKAKNAFESGRIEKIFKYIFLNSNQKKIYKKLKENQYNLLNSKKSTFNDKNIFEAYNFNFFYGKTQALFNINIKIKRKKVTAFIGPSGCGKSTFLRCLNRMNDQITATHSNGSIYFNDGTNILSKDLNPLVLTTKVGMVFQKATPFPMSIYENVAYGPKSHGINNKELLDKIVQESLQDAALWEEVKDKLFTSASALSGGQQQRLCIARAIALKPEVLLMDESTSGLDPIATSKIEDLILNLKKNYTIILVTHSMTQVQRVSDYCAFFYKGQLIEYAPTRNMFMNPKNKKTKDYISGKIS